MERYYTDKGLISKGSCLNVQDTDGKFSLLLPTTDLPETKGAPSTQAKTVLTDNSVTEVEGLQTNAQKTYTFNYHRDNIRQLNKYAGKNLTFLERNTDNTGEKFTGSFQYGRSAIAVDGIAQGQIFLTVGSADNRPIDDVRDLMKKTSIITTPLSDVYLAVSGKHEITVETDPAEATIAVTSSATAIATATITGKKLVITGVAKGFCMIELVTSTTGEASSYRTIAVEITA